VSSDHRDVSSRNGELQARKPIGVLRTAVRVPCGPCRVPGNEFGASCTHFSVSSTQF
jgi:hypothetical protein